MSLAISRRTIACIAAAAIIIVAVVGYAAHINGGTLDFSETDARIVVSGSMDGEPREQYDIPTIPTGSLILIHEVHDYSSLKVGDVLTFDYVHPVSHESMVVTHRIIDISESDGVFTYTLKGDTAADDPTNGSVQMVTSDSGDILGKVVGVSHWLGVLIQFLSTWTGRILLVLVPCLILIASEVRNIVRILKGGKNGDSPEAEEPEDMEEPEPAEVPKEKENGPGIGDRLHSFSQSLSSGVRGIAGRIIVPRGYDPDSHTSEDAGPDGPVFMHREKEE